MLNGKKDHAKLTLIYTNRFTDLHFNISMRFKQKL